MKNSIVFALCLLLGAILVFHQAEARSGLRLKKLIKYGLIANAFTGKKILFPLPLPVPIPVFQENIHHIPTPVHHDVGYGFDQGGQYGGGFGGGYGGGFGGGYGGGYGGGLGGGIHGGW